MTTVYVKGLHGMSPIDLAQLSQSIRSKSPTQNGERIIRKVKFKLMLLTIFDAWRKGGSLATRSVKELKMF